MNKSSYRKTNQSKCRSGGREIRAIDGRKDTRKHTCSIHTDEREGRNKKHGKIAVAAMLKEYK